MKRDRHEEAETHPNPEKTVHIVEPRPAREKSVEHLAEDPSPPEVIDAEWVEMSAPATSASASMPESSVEAGAPRSRKARAESSEFSFVNYVLLFFSAALLSALVMLAVLGQI